MLEIAGSVREGEWGAEGASIHLSQYIKGVLRRPLSRSHLVHRYVGAFTVTRTHPGRPELMTHNA